MARTPQSFEKRQRERRKQQKREEKLERRLIRGEEKKLAKQDGESGASDSPSEAGPEGDTQRESERPRPAE